MTNQLIFQNTKLQAINKDGQIWLSSAELARALDYSNNKAVTMIYNKHADEFTDAMTTVLESSTVKGMPYKIRLFSLRGCHLIAMFSRTKVAKLFRKWVLDILDKEIFNRQKKQFSNDDLCSISWSIKAGERLRQHVQKATDALYILKSELAPSFYSMGVDYKSTIETARKILERETQHIIPEEQGIMEENWRRVLPDIRKNLIK